MVNLKNVISSAVEKSGQTNITESILAATEFFAGFVATFIPLYLIIQFLR